MNKLNNDDNSPKHDYFKHVKTDFILAYELANIGMHIGKEKLAETKHALRQTKQAKMSRYAKPQITTDEIADYGRKIKHLQKYFNCHFNNDGDVIATGFDSFNNYMGFLINSSKSVCLASSGSEYLAKIDPKMRDWRLIAITKPLVKDYQLAEFATDYGTKLFMLADDEKLYQLYDPQTETEFWSITLPNLLYAFEMPLTQSQRDLIFKMSLITPVYSTKTLFYDSKA